MTDRPTPDPRLAEALWNADFLNAYADPLDARRMAQQFLHPANEPGRSLLEDAARGAAVRRLADPTGEMRTVVVCPRYSLALGRHDGAWRVNVYDRDADEDDPPVIEGDGPTIAEALEAAIGQALGGDR